MSSRKQSGDESVGLLDEESLLALGNLWADQARRFRGLRQHYGWSIKEATSAVNALLPEWSQISTEILRRYENGTLNAEEPGGPLRLAAMARVYGVPYRWLVPDIRVSENDMNVIARLVRAMRS